MDDETFRYHELLVRELGKDFPFAAALPPFNRQITINDTARIERNNAHLQVINRIPILGRLFRKNPDASAIRIILDFHLKVIKSFHSRNTQ